MNFSPEKVISNRLILLAGEEEFARRRALEDILRAAEVAKDDFDLEIVDADVRSPSEWFASVSTAPFLSPKRTMVVRHLLRSEADKLGGTDFSKLPESSLLILVADEETGSDDKVQRMKTTVRKGWEKAVTAAKGQVLTFEPDPKAAAGILKSEAEKAGKTFSSKALAELIEMTGGSLSRGLDELEKLVLFVGNNPQIRESDVRAVSVPSRDWSVFKMVDATVQGDVPEALRHLKTMVGSSTNAQTEAFRSILPQLSRTFRLLWQARVCLDARTTPGDAPEAIRSTFPEKPNLAKETYRLNQYMASARKTSLPALRRCLGVISDTDARLKGALPSFSPNESLERMVLELDQAIRVNR